MADFRSGPDLIRATKPFSSEDPRRTWRLLGTTVLIALVFAFIAASESLGPWRWIGAVGLGFTHVRLFIFFHDAMHGAIFRRSRLGRSLMITYGYCILTPSRVWKDSHNYHHAHTARIFGANIGSYPVMTVRMYDRATRLQRFVYRSVRHPINMVLGYFSVFMLGLCIRPLFKNFRRNWMALVSLGIHFLLAVILYAIGGFASVFAVLVGPLMLGMAVGSYLFYAQHNYPEVTIHGRQEWTYTDAAIESSCLMVGGAVMRWITGDIGFHHVHHLNSQIPFYRLEETMQNIPELQSPAVVTLSLRNVWGSLKCALWDPDRGRMVTFREARERAEAPPINPDRAACGFSAQ